MLLNNNLSFFGDLMAITLLWVRLHLRKEGQREGEDGDRRKKGRTGEAEKEREEKEEDERPRITTLPLGDGWIGEKDGKGKGNGAL